MKRLTVRIDGSAYCLGHYQNKLIITIAIVTLVIQQRIVALRRNQMSKSVLVIDTPRKCYDCPLLNGADECTVQDDDANFNADDSWDELMKGCPLKPLPERHAAPKIATGYEIGYEDGWNECSQKIMRGAK